MADVYWVGPTGSQSWATPGNWSTGAVPVNGDNVYILVGTSNIDSGLNQSAVLLANLFISKAFMATGTIGTAGAGGTFLQIGATKWTVGTLSSDGDVIDGSGRILIDFGTAVFSGLILDTPSASLDAGLEPFRIKGVNVGNVLNQISGIAGVATTKPAEVSTLASMNVRGGILNSGSGVTCPSVTNNGGTVKTYHGGTTFTNTAGTLYTYGTAIITTLICGGQTYINHRTAAGASITTLRVLSNGVADFTQNPQGLTITNAVQLFEQSAISAFSPQQITASGNYQCQQCGFSDVILNFGDNVTFSVA